MKIANIIWENTPDNPCCDQCYITAAEKIIEYLNTEQPSHECPKLEEIEKIIAKNAPIEFIQVIEPFARARVYRELARAILDYVEGNT